MAINCRTSKDKGNTDNNSGRGQQNKGLHCWLHGSWQLRWLLHGDSRVENCTVGCHSLRGWPAATADKRQEPFPLASDQEENNSRSGEWLWQRRRGVKMRFNNYYITNQLSVETNYNSMRLFIVFTALYIYSFIICNFAINKVEIKLNFSAVFFKSFIITVQIV